MAKKDIDEIVLVGGSSRIPRIQEIIQQFFKKQLCQGVHPDEAVAQGAGNHICIDKTELICHI